MVTNNLWVLEQFGWEHFRNPPKASSWPEPFSRIIPSIQKTHQPWTERDPRQGSGVQWKWNIIVLNFPDAKGETDAHFRGLLGRFNETIHVKYSINSGSFFLFNFHYTSWKPFEFISWRSASGEINWAYSFGGEGLFSHFLPLQSLLLFHHLWATSDIRWEVTCPWEVLSSLIQGGGGRGRWPEPWVLLLVASSLVSEPVLRRLPLTGRGSWLAHLCYQRWQPCCSKVVINRIEAEGIKAAGSRLRPVGFDSWVSHMAAG